MKSNPNLANMEGDNLYHLALDTSNHDLPAMFGDVRFVCIGGTSSRMENFARYIMKELDYKLPTGATLQDLSAAGHRFCMYKVGPVLSVSHGMGVPSLSIMLHEVIKLLSYAGAKDPVIIRIGTSGGIGITPGTVVVSNGALNGLLKPEHNNIILGKVVPRPATMDQSLAKDLLEMGKQHDFTTVTGKTMCCDDFYEGQGRLDGAICEHTEEEKMSFLKRLDEVGVKNIEMEATALAAITKAAGVRSGNVCVTIVNRLEGDQVTFSKEELTQFALRPQQLVASYIKRELGKESKMSNGNGVSR